MQQTPSQDTPTQTTQSCPECQAAVTTAPTMLGELIDCADCGAELETISVDPARFAVAPELEEDWGE